MSISVLSEVDEGDGVDATSATETSSSRKSDEDAAEPVVFRSFDSRLSTPFPARLPLTIASSLLAGFLLGASKGGTQAAYRYRAENAHRFPTTQTGWYLYHKSKNYHTMLGGIKQGLRFGGRLSVWATLFVSSEEVIDRLRGDPGQQDAVSTLCAGMATVGLYSWKNGRDLFTAARMAKTGFKVSLAYGLCQDLVSVLRGRSPAYVAWLQKRVLGYENSRGET